MGSSIEGREVIFSDDAQKGWALARKADVLRQEETARSADRALHLAIRQDHYVEADSLWERLTLREINIGVGCSNANVPADASDSATNADAPLFAPSFEAVDGAVESDDSTPASPDVDSHTDIIDTTILDAPIQDATPQEDENQRAGPDADTVPPDSEACDPRKDITVALCVDHDGDKYLPETPANEDCKVLCTNQVEAFEELLEAGYLKANKEGPFDCDDTNPELNPETVWYYDGDGDGFGTDNKSTNKQQCVAPESFVSNTNDCDDSSDKAHPGLEEICSDGLNNDCIGVVDRGPGLICLSSAELVFEGEEVGDEAGYAMAAADMTGSGIASLIIGAPSEGTYLIQKRGALYGFYGSSLQEALDALKDQSALQIVLSLSTADFKLTGADGAKPSDAEGDHHGSHAGYSIAAGNADGNGCGDFLTGALYGMQTGVVYLVYGRGPVCGGTMLSGENGLDDIGVKFLGEGKNDALGYSVAFGTQELLMGAYSNGNHAGAVYGVELGSAPLTGSFDLSQIGSPALPGTKFTGEKGGDRVGQAVFAGMINSDSVADVITGSDGYDINNDDGNSDEGGAYVAFGPYPSGNYSLTDTLKNGNGIKLEGGSSQAYAGIPLFSAQLFGNGKPEAFFVGARGIGKLYMYPPLPPGASYNSGSLSSAPVTWIVPGGSGTGTSVAAGKFTSAANAGKLDILIGAPFASGGGTTSTGVVGLVQNGDLPLSGEVDLFETASLLLVGESVADSAGWAVLGLPDLDGDGLDEIVVSAPAYPKGGKRGRVYGFLSKGLQDYLLP